MTRRFSTIAAVVLTSALWAGVVDAQTSYVRYSQDDGPIYWGVLNDSFISRLSAARFSHAGSPVQCCSGFAAPSAGVWSSYQPPCSLRRIRPSVLPSTLRSAVRWSVVAWRHRLGESFRTTSTLLDTSPSPPDKALSRMPSSA